MGLTLCCPVMCQCTSAFISLFKSSMFSVQPFPYCVPVMCGECGKSIIAPHWTRQPLQFMWSADDYRPIVSTVQLVLMWVLIMGHMSNRFIIAVWSRSVVRADRIEGTASERNASTMLSASICFHIHFDFDFPLNTVNNTFEEWYWTIRMQYSSGFDNTYNSVLLLKSCKSKRQNLTFESKIMQN